MKKSFSYSPGPFRRMLRDTKKLAVANAVYITDTDKEGKKIKATEFKKRVREIEDLFLRLFGGFTNDEINYGKFLSKTKNKVMTEKVAKIISFADVKSFVKHRKELERVLYQKKKEWNQEKIAYEFEGDLYYI